MNATPTTVPTPRTEDLLVQVRSFADQGLLGTDRRQDMTDFRQLVESLDGTPGALQNLFAAMDAPLVAALADDMSQGGVSAWRGMTRDEQQGVIAVLARNLDGATGARVAALMGPEQLEDWGGAMAAESVEKRTAFVLGLLPQTTDETSIVAVRDTHSGPGDRHAEPVGTVLSSLAAEDPAAFARLLTQLDGPQLRSAMLSSVRQSTWSEPLNGMPLYMAGDASVLCRLLIAARRAPDIDTQVRLFVAATDTLESIEPPRARQQIARALGDLLDSNPVGLVQRLTEQGAIAGPRAPLTRFFMQELANDPTDPAGDRHLDHFFAAVGGPFPCMLASQEGRHGTREYPLALAAGIVRGSWMSAIRHSATAQKSDFSLLSSFTTSSSLTLNFAGAHKIAGDFLLSPGTRALIVVGGAAFRDMLIVKRGEVDANGRDLRNTGEALAHVEQGGWPLRDTVGFDTFVEAAEDVVATNF